MAWMNAIPENKLPYIDTINLVYIADSSQILTQAQAGQLDWFGENGKDVLSLDQISQLTAADVGTVYPFTSGSPSAIALKVGQEPFSDIRVRQAMQLAIDLEAINTFLGNTGEVVVPGLWSTALSWSTVDEWPDDLKAQFTTKTADLAANQEKARQLLAMLAMPTVSPSRWSWIPPPIWSCSRWLPPISNRSASLWRSAWPLK